MDGCEEGETSRLGHCSFSQVFTNRPGASKQSQKERRCTGDRTGRGRFSRVFSHQPIIGIDAHVAGRLIHGPPLMRLIQASATQIPLADASCDYAVCVDTLEHLPPSQTDSAIREALRVTRHQFFIAVPSGRAAALLEKFFYLMLAPVYRLFHKYPSFL